MGWCIPFVAGKPALSSAAPAAKEMEALVLRRCRTYFIVAALLPLEPGCGRRISPLSPAVQSGPRAAINAVKWSAVKAPFVPLFEEVTSWGNHLSTPTSRCTCLVTQTIHTFRLIGLGTRGTPSPVARPCSRGLWHGGLTGGHRVCRVFGDGQECSCHVCRGALGWSSEDVGSTTLDTTPLEAVVTDEPIYLSYSLQFDPRTTSLQINGVILLNGEGISLVPSNGNH